MGNPCFTQRLASCSRFWATLRSLVFTRPSRPGLFSRVGEVPTMTREPAYDDERRLEAEAKSASE